MKSMTGFGRAEIADEHYQIEIEIKSVNQRFLDIQLRLPKEMNAYDLIIRQCVKDVLNRGRIEIHGTMKQLDTTHMDTIVQWPLIHSLIGEIETELHQTYSQKQLDPVMIVQQLVNNSNYVQVVENKPDKEVYTLFLALLEKALLKLDQSRRQEGAKIQQLLLQYSQAFLESVHDVTSYAAVYEKEHFERLQAKLTEIICGPIEESRVLTEVAILLEKGDIQEELDRLVIHYETMQKLLKKEEPVGRELDFLVQEINREVNTIGSKANAIEIKNQVIRMKTVLEKIREQIQNIE